MATTDAASTSIPADSSIRPAGRIWAILVLVLIFGLHTYRSVRWFPTLASIVDPDSPVLLVDHAIHEYHGALGAKFLRETGTSWGYDPYFMAGYPETPVWDSSSNPAILFNRIGGGEGFRAYKIGVLVCSILVLVLIASGARAAGLDLGEVAAASVLAYFYDWVGFPMPGWRWGLFAFISACAGVGLLLGLCTRFDRKPGRGSWLALTLAGSALFYFHVTAPVMVIGGLLAFYLTVAGRHGWRWHSAIFAAGGLAVAVNLHWLIPLWKFRALRVGSGFFMTTHSVWFLRDYFLADTMEGRTAVKLLALGFGGLAVWWFRGRRTQAAAFGGSIVALLILFGCGSFWGPTRIMEPLRFRIGLMFLLTVPAGSMLVMASRGFARWIGGARGRVATALLWLVGLMGWGLFERPLLEDYVKSLTQTWPFVVGFQPEMKELVDLIKTKTDLSGRILFEDQLRVLELTDPESVHWTPLLPKLLEPESRMFIGGLYHMAFIQHHKRASFGDFHLGTRPIDEFSPAELEDYFRTYNIGWVICWSPLSRFTFDRNPLARRLATVRRFSTPGLPPSHNEHEWKAMVRRAGRDVALKYMLEGERTYSIYQVDRPRSYFLVGKGRLVSVAPNRVELADVQPEGGRVVVSLHWIDSWKAEPPLFLTPQTVFPDPVDFVRIEMSGPVDRVVLTSDPRH